MSNLRNIHGEVFDHLEACPDLNCCMCECRTCKRPWEAAGRPHPRDCPEHGDKAQKPGKSAWVHILEAADDEAVDR